MTELALELEHGSDAVGSDDDVFWQSDDVFWTPRPFPSPFPRQTSAGTRVREAIEPCAHPTRMKLRKASGAHKHRRWFWLTVGRSGL